MTFELWCDVSAYQVGANQPIDFNKMKSAGAVGVCIRKSLGYYRDVTFEQNWAGAGAAGLKRTLYAVPYPQFDFARQILAMTTNPDGSPFLGPLDRPMWLDVERNPYMTRSLAIAKILAFLFELTGHYGTAPDVYTAAWAWEPWYSIAKGWGEDWRLVVASYGSVPRIPIGWAFTKTGVVVPKHASYSGWQFSADGNGLGPQFGCHSAAVDLSWQRVI